MTGKQDKPMNIGQPDVSKEARRAGRRLSGAPASIRKVVLGMMDDLAPRLDEMFANVDDYFFSRAERADDNGHHQTFFDAMRTIRSHREEIARRCLDAILESAADFWTTQTSARPGPGSEKPRQVFAADTMTILTEDEMEVSVAISGIVHKGKARFGRETRILTETLNGIASQQATDQVNHPLGVASIAQAFMRGTQGLSLELPVLLSFLKLFERHVVDHLGPVYGAAIARLERDGVEIRTEAPVRPAVSPHPRIADDRRPGTGGTVSFAELQRYLDNGYRGDAVRAEGAAGQQANVSVDQLIDTVSSVQHRFLQQLPGPGGGPQTYPNLQTLLLSLPVSEGGFRDAGRDQQDTLRLVSDLFEYMFRNENLSVASKALIARMQFPVLKIALIDRSLFSDSDHPVRELLNRVGADGIGWPSSEALLKRNSLYLAAEGIVTRLNDTPKPDADTFARLVQEWSELVSRYQRRTKTAVRRLNETVLGKAKLEAAKRIVQQTINSRAAGAHLPGPITAFISNEWTQAMVVACVKHGTDGDQWRQICHVLDDLLQASAPAEPDGDQPRPGVEELISKMRGILERFGTTESAAAESLRPIADVLDRSSNDLNTAAYEVEDLEIMEEIHLTDVEEPDADGDGSEDYRLANLEQGTWMEIDDVDGRSLRCQLAVAVDDAQTYVFNDDAGIKVREMSRKTLLHGLSSGSIRIVRQELLVEKAIDELMASLKSYAPGRHLNTADQPHPA